MRDRYDVVVVGGGHNGLVAAAYLARAGRTVLVCEAGAQVGGAAVSARVFPGVDARLSRYAYLVSLMPERIIRELDLGVPLLPRPVASCTPTEAPSALLVRNDDEAATAGSFRALTGGDAEFGGWNRLGHLTRRVAEAVFPTLLDPLISRAAMRARVADDAAWEALFERPLGELIEDTLAHDLVRGVALTDGLIGTLTHAHAGDLAQNRCFLYHVIGGCTGLWRVPAGGMGALTGAIADRARTCGAEIRTGARVTAIHGDDGGAQVVVDGLGTVGAGHVLAGVAPAVLHRLMGESPAEAPVGAQLKVNMVLSRLPRLRCGVDPRDAFAGTLHVDEGYAQLDTAHRQAVEGRLPARPAFEVYCHSLTDPTILAPALAARGVHTLTLFGLHMPPACFAGDHDAARDEAVRRCMAGLDAHLEEPIADCLLADADGRPCIEAHTPQDLEAELDMPGGHIFHRDLSWPFTDDEAAVGTWGVETRWSRVLLCGAGAVRGGGVSGVPGRNAAMAVLGAGAPG
ncbi:MAG: NAD(P)/FAD-dependent oxidoreductase [Thermoleophilia bacterium]